MKEYVVLRTVATIFAVLGWIILILGVIASLAFGAMAGGSEGALIAIVGTLYSAFMGAWLIATKDLFYCLIDIEENTRNTVEYIKKDKV